MSSGNQIADPASRGDQFGRELLSFLLQQRWVFGIIVIGLVLIGVGTLLSGLLSGLVGTYGILLVVVGVLIYLFLFVLKVRMGD